MMTDTILKKKGLDILSDNLGLVNAERFISIILKEPFDYTEWQQCLYRNISLDDFCENIKNYKRNKTQSV